jgi:hypothetical protein
MEHQKLLIRLRRITVPGAEVLEHGEHIHNRLDQQCHYSPHAVVGQQPISVFSMAI